MRKFFTLLSTFLAANCFVNAQDTLLYENFDVDNTASYALFNSGNDLTWVNFDVDQLPDANGRPQNWFWSLGCFATNDTTGCLLSSSWFSAPGLCQNYLITPPIPIIDGNAILYWKSAPRQTPLYLDGYKVLVSTTDNFELSFTDTLFVAAEYVSGSSTNGGNFSLYTFSPGFVHGEDGTYVEYDATSDSSRQIGILRPFNVSLAQFSGQTIYIAFLHDAFDDNIMGLDDILVTGTLPVGVAEVKNESQLVLSPNPASDKIEVSYYLPVSSEVTARIYDIKGSLVKETRQGMQITGNQKLFLSVADLASGDYNLVLIAGKKATHLHFAVSH